jgi:formylglycine-generating enzyme required for sulfatase activity
MTLTNNVAKLVLIASAVFCLLISNQAQAQDPSSLQPGSRFRECPECQEMTVIPAGSVAMERSNEPTNFPPVITKVAVPIHRIGFGTYDVTLGEYTKFMNETHRDPGDHCYGWDTKIAQFVSGKGRTWRNPGFVQTSKDPVVCADFLDALAYVDWINKKLQAYHHQPANFKPYRLPTEEEVAYAARANSTSPFPSGDSIDRSVANYGSENCPPCSGDHAGPDKWDFTSPVGSFPPNRFGLYDMVGNVWQISNSCYNFQSPPFSAPVTERCIPGANEGNQWAVVVHGGSWMDPSKLLRFSFYDAANQHVHSNYIGFRLVRDLEGSE